MDDKTVLRMLNVLEQVARTVARSERRDVGEFVDHIRALKEILSRDPTRLEEYLERVEVSA